MKFSSTTSQSPSGMVARTNGSILPNPLYEVSSRSDFANASVMDRFVRGVGVPHGHRMVKARGAMRHEEK